MTRVRFGGMFISHCVLSDYALRPFMAVSGLTARAPAYTNVGLSIILALMYTVPVPATYV